MSSQDQHTEAVTCVGQRAKKHHKLVTELSSTGHVLLFCRQERCKVEGITEPCTVVSEQLSLLLPRIIDSHPTVTLVPSGLHRYQYT